MRGSFYDSKMQLIIENSNKKRFSCGQSQFSFVGEWGSDLKKVTFATGLGIDFDDKIEIFKDGIYV